MSEKNLDQRPARSDVAPDLVPGLQWAIDYCNAMLRQGNDRMLVEAIRARLENVRDIQPQKQESTESPARGAESGLELAGYFSFCHDKEKWLQQKSEGAEFNHLFTPLYAMAKSKA